LYRASRRSASCRLPNVTPRTANPSPPALTTAHARTNAARRSPVRAASRLPRLITLLFVSLSVMSYSLCLAFMLNNIHYILNVVKYFIKFFLNFFIFFIDSDKYFSDIIKMEVK
jgi:hypothetical protein